MNLKQESQTHCSKFMPTPTDSTLAAARKVANAQQIKLIFASLLSVDEIAAIIAKQFTEHFVEQQVEIERLNSENYELRQSCAKIIRCIKQVLGFQNWPDISGNFNDGVCDLLVKDHNTIAARLKAIEQRIGIILGWTKCGCGDEHCGVWYAPNSEEPSLALPPADVMLNQVAARLAEMEKALRDLISILNLDFDYRPDDDDRLDSAKKLLLKSLTDTTPTAGLKRVEEKE